MFSLIGKEKLKLTTPPGIQTIRVLFRTLTAEILVLAVIDAEKIID